MKILFLLLSVILEKITSQCASVQNPTVETCYSQSTSQNICCMISSPGYTPKYNNCVEISSSSYVGQNLYNNSGDLWRLNCSLATPNHTEAGPCGNPNPKWGTDCWNFSTDSDSCCYYLSLNTTGTSACQWYGSKQQGNITRSTDKLYLSCNSYYITLSFLTFLFLILTFIF